MRVLFAVLTALLVASATSYAQRFAFGIKFTGLAIHPKKQPNVGLFQTKFDQRGNVVLDSGITLSAEIGIYRKLGIKLAQAILWRDCAGKFAALSHLGLNIGGAGAMLGNTKHGISGSIGPMIYWRKSWKDLPGYIADDSWLKKRKNSAWETKIIPLGGQAEYNYYFSENYGASVNVLPGYPDIISITAGITGRK